MNSLLEVTDYTKPVEDVIDRLTFGGSMVLIGMAVVFAVLIIIWASLALFKVFFTQTGEKNQKPVETPAPTVIEKAHDDNEIVAVIAAAIAAAESETNGMKFKVVSFRRK